jgi:thiosulfate/3-mercaptopyruvate sulfurtransferase
MLTERVSIFALVVFGVFGAAAMLAAPPTETGLLISSADLASRLNDADLVVLHIADRPSSGYEQAHIPGARFIRYGDVAVNGADGIGSELPPLEQLERVFEDAGVSDTSRVVVYGSTVAASRLFFTLDVIGHPRAAILDGGLRAWQAEGRPVETGPPPVHAKGSFTPWLRNDRIATAQWIQQQAKHVALVDVRPDDEFTGADGGMAGAHAPGHIEGARQLPWDALVSADGTFLPADRLRAKLAAAGAAPGKPVVSYCMVGMRASVVYFVARHLGLDARLYDGSIVDWSRRGLPTKTGR